jgi:peptide alpha-N-acetyltransferase
LKYDPNNQNVLRDLGQLQIQLRDYEGYAETRRQVLISKPGMQINWITYAVALYLVNFMSLKDIELKLQKSFGSSYII